MSAAIRTVEIEQGDVTYDSDMPMGALRGLLESGTEGSLSGLMESMADIVLSWPFKGEPSDTEAWDKLKRTEFNAVVSGVTGDLGELGE